VWKTAYYNILTTIIGRRRALDRKMDDALRSNKPSRRKGGGIDLEAAGDAELEEMRQRMSNACQADSESRNQGKVATHKLKLLPDVVALLNRNTLRSSIVDPDINILEAVRFFLEPADTDAALPNFQIQRELFAVLKNLSMTKEALTASGIGKVVIFYTKSSQTQRQIKAIAERLLGEWSRIVLGRGKDMRAKTVQSATYDPMASSQRPAGSQIDRAAIAAEKRKRALEIPVVGNRARVQGGVGTYTIAPVNNLSNVVQQDSRRMGSSGESAFRKVATRATGKR
jgi:transcription factor SPN1